MLNKTKKKEPRAVRISGRITKTLLQKATALAIRNKWSISDVIEEALARFVA